MYVVSFGTYFKNLYNQLDISKSEKVTQKIIFACCSEAEIPLCRLSLEKWRTRRKIKPSVNSVARTNVGKDRGAHLKFSICAFLFY